MRVFKGKRLLGFAGDVLSWQSIKRYPAVFHSHTSPESKARILIIALIAVGLIAAICIQNRPNYTFNNQEKQLLGKAYVNQNLLHENETFVSYNITQTKVPDKAKASAYLATQTDASSTSQYGVTFNKDPKKGITFKSEQSNSYIAVTPKYDLNNGRYDDGRMVYADGAHSKHVYTIKRNGVKEDILLSKRPASDTLTYSWNLELDSTEEARILPDGGVGIYAYGSYLGNNLQIADQQSQILIDKARQRATKDTLVSILPAPFITNGKYKDYKNAHYSLDGSVLTLTVSGLKSSTWHYPISIDPSLVLTSTTDFRSGTDNGSIDYTTTNEIRRTSISGGAVNSFTTSANYFSIERKDFGAVAYNKYLYVIGGDEVTSDTNCKNSGTSIYCNDVQYAPINSDGSIGAWTLDTTSYFATARSDLAVVAYNGYMYLMGGTFSTIADGVTCKGNTPPSSQYCNDVQKAQINSDGSLGTWGLAGTGNTSNYFSVPRHDLSAAVYNGFIYITGGQKAASDTTCKNDGVSNTRCNDIQYAAINADGTIGAWTTNANYWATPRTDQALAIYNGVFYVGGGDHGTSDTACKNTGTSTQRCNDVQWANIANDGSVGAFSATNTAYFLEPRRSTYFAVAQGYLYVAGGDIITTAQNCNNTGSNNVNCNDVQYAPIYGDGSVGSFTRTSYFLTPRAWPRIAIVDGFIYIFGGGNNTDLPTQCKPSGSDTRCNDTQWAQITNINAQGNYNGTGTWPSAGAGPVAGTYYFTTPRTGQAMVAYRGYMYVLGGKISAASGTTCKFGTPGSSVYCNDVQVAQINSDGSLGSFSATNGFTTPRTGLRAVAYNGYMYITGGDTGTASTSTCKQNASGNGYTIVSSAYCNDVQYVQINANGTLGTWASTVSATFGYAVPRTALGLAAYNGYLYIAGGLPDVTSTACNDSGSPADCNDIWYAPINTSNGTIGAFTRNGTFITTARDSFGFGIYNGVMYVIGGGTYGTTNCKQSYNTTLYPNNQFGCNDVQWAKVNSNGTVGSFPSTAEVKYFNWPRYGTAGLVGNGVLYIMGGDGNYASFCNNIGSGTRCNDVQYSVINPDGSPGNFNFAPYFATPRLDPSVIYYNGKVYIGGGQPASTNQCKNDGTTTTFCNDVQPAILTAPGYKASYERMVDLGASMTSLDSIVYNGSTHYYSDCRVDITYKTASSTGVLGAATTITDALPGTTYTFTGQTNKRYLYLEFAFDDSTCGTQTSITDVTINYTNGTTPGAPTLSTPANSATSISTLPTFTLSDTDTEGDYLRYKIEVCTTSNCSSVLRTIDQTSSQTGWAGQDAQSSTAYASGTTASHTYQATALTASTQYWWRAYAIDPGGTNTFSTVSGIFTFTTRANQTPAAPTLIEPASSATGIATQPTFRLRSSDGDDDNLKYKIEICSVSNCSSILRTIDQTSSQTGWAGQNAASATSYTSDISVSNSTIALHFYQSPGLTSGTQYWWRAYAIDPTGTNTFSAASGIQSFTIGSSSVNILGGTTIKGGTKIAN